MRLDAASLAGQRHIDEGLVVAQILEGRGDAALVVVPAEAEVLCVVHVCGA